MNYRGFDMPKPQGRGNSWTINDGAVGYFTGTKDQVMSQWRRKVNEYSRGYALDNGEYDYATGEPNLTCLKCGAAVADPWLHNNWHWDNE
jgi:hypothetical protein